MKLRFYLNCFVIVWVASAICLSCYNCCFRNDINSLKQFWYFPFFRVRSNRTILEPKAVKIKSFLFNWVLFFQQSYLDPGRLGPKRKCYRWLMLLPTPLCTSYEIFREIDTSAASNRSFQPKKAIILFSWKTRNKRFFFSNDWFRCGKNTPCS